MGAEKKQKIRKKMCINKKNIHVDFEDWDRIKGYSWKVVKQSGILYVRRLDTNNRMVFMHHDIIGNPPEGYDTHHKNGNGLDNRKCNLEHIKKGLHSRYRRKKSEIKDRIKGIHRDGDKWEVKCYDKHVGKMLYVGRFFTRELAHLHLIKKMVEIAQISPSERV